MPENGYIEVKQSGKSGILDMKGKLVVPCIYDEISSGDFTACVNYGVASVKKKGNWGVIDTTGKVIIPFKYNSIECFWDNGTAIATKNGKTGCLNCKGQTLVPFIYDYISYIKEGVRQVLYNGRTGYVDTTGKEIIACKYSNGLLCSDGLIAVRNGTHWGYINKKDSVIIPFVYDTVASFNEGLASVSLHGQTGFIDKHNSTIIPFIYQQGQYNFSNGYARVMKDGKAGIINKQGKVIIPFEYEDYGYDKFEGGCFMLERYLPNEGQTYAIYDSNGKAITGFNYENIIYYGRNQFEVKKAGKEGIINNKGDTIVPIEYDGSIWNSDYNLYSVVKNGKLGCIDSTGKTVIPFIFNSDVYDYFSDGTIGCLFLDTLAIAPYHGTWRIINRKGQFVDHFKGTQKVRLYYENGILGTSGRLKDFYKEGKWIGYYENGKIEALITYKHGQKDGDYKRWDTSGFLTDYVLYKNDTVEKTILSSSYFQPVYFSQKPPDTNYFSNGKLEFCGNHDSTEPYMRIGKWIEGDLDSNNKYFYSTGIYISGIKEGEWKHYNEQDSLLFVETYKDDMVQYPDGDNVIYNFNGTVYEKGKMLNNKKEGLWISYQGKVKLFETEYFQGERSGINKEYFRNGNLAYLEHYVLLQKNNDSTWFVNQHNYRSNEGFPISILSGDWEAHYENGQVKESGKYSVEKPTLDSLYFKMQKKGHSVFIDSIDTVFGSFTPCSIKVGVWTEYYKNGQIKAIGEYYPAEFNIFTTITVSDSSGGSSTSITSMPFYFKDKTWKYYNENGQLIGEEFYNRTRRIKVLDYKK